MILDETRADFVTLAKMLSGQDAQPKGLRARHHRQHLVNEIYRESLNIGVTMHPNARDHVFETLRDELCALWSDLPRWLRVNPIVWLDAATQGMHRGWQIHDDKKRLMGLTYQRPTEAK